MASTTRYLQQTTQLAGMNILIDSYRPNFARGKRVTPSHIDQIRALYNTWITHYHQYYDQHFIRYGSLGGQPGTSGQYRDSTTPIGAVSADDTVAAGRSDYRTFFDYFKDLVTKFNAYAQEHYHQVYDSF